MFQCLKPTKAWCRSWPGTLFEWPSCCLCLRSVCGWWASCSHVKFFWLVSALGRIDPLSSDQELAERYVKQYRQAYKSAAQPALRHILRAGRNEKKWCKRISMDVHCPIYFVGVFPWVFCFKVQKQTSIQCKLFVRNLNFSSEKCCLFCFQNKFAYFSKGILMN